MTEKTDGISRRVFHYFAKISEIPRGSGHTDKISGFLMDFAGEKGLKACRDAAGNVVIRKEGSKGYEDAPGVILQGHTDMVCEKKPGTDHDFLTQGLTLKREGDFLYADGTTLGGDDGIGAAFMLAILEDREIPHPPLEAVFTVDEEIGMLGAAALDMSALRGRILINLDSEEEGHLLCGCAGGLTAECRIPVRFGAVSGSWYEIRITGLTGGHSGSEIHKNRANSNLLAGRLLYRLGQRLEFVLAELSGGNKDNAISRETTLLLGADSGEEDCLRQVLEELERELRREYAGSDEGIRIVLTSRGPGVQPALDPVSLQKVVFFLMHVPDGVEKMSGEIPGLVETSSNLGILRLGPESLNAWISVRSSVGSAKNALADRICYLSEFLGGDYTASGEYPAWEFRRDSALREIMRETWMELYGAEPQVDVIHAGVECGLFYEALEGLDCVSVGPDILDIHTTEERLSVSSAERVYRFLLKVLEKIKEYPEGDHHIIERPQTAGQQEKNMI